MFKRMLVLMIVLTMVLTLFYSCGKKQREFKRDSVTVLVDSVKRKEMSQYLDLSGQIVGREEVKIFSELPGKIASIKVVEGQYVTKDTIVAYLDRSQVGMDYALAPVRSPISGYILSIYVVPGQLVAAGSVPIASVGNLNNMDVVISIPEKYLKDVRIGQKLYLKVNTYPDEVFEGDIYRQDLAVDPVSRTLTVRGRIYNPKGKLFSGMYADVSILLKKEPSIIVIPSSALVKIEDEYYVFVNENNIAKLRKVRIGFNYKENVAIREGLNEGEEIVVFGREFLKDGTPINPVKE